jgi:small subunit ribosomal protein S20
MAKSKRTKTDLKRQRRNKAVKSGIKSTVRELNQAASRKEAAPAREALTKAVRQLDKAASKGVMHRNTAGRKKSRLTRKVNAAIKPSQVQA